ncbi:MAG: hypothetical protein J7K46_04150, partial [Bacteroidales bacterium]|nr:hypothetical protein [Bacteroidales bacterium]
MRFDYFQYKIEIKNLKFTTDEGVVHPKTALITLLGEKGEMLGVEIFGYREISDWYRQIEAGKPLNMNQCYVRDFSLAAYRNARKMEKKEYVKIPGITARNAFFESRMITDFSFAEFSDGNTDFEFSHFTGGPVSFGSARFGDGNPVFNNVLFRNGNVDFGNAVFGAGIKGFKNSVFRDGKKDFQYCDFGPGEVSFNNTEFYSGEVSFINAVFGEGNVSFKIARVTGGKVDFHYAKFGKGNISFERVEFGDSRVDFRAVEFNEGRVNFNRSLFGEGDIMFEGSELPAGRFSFKRADMGKGMVSFEWVNYAGAELFFEKTSFGKGNVSFLGGQFDLLSLQSCHLDHYFDLRVASCRYLDLSDTIARDIIDLKPYDQDVKVYVLNLSGMRLLGRMYIDWEENHVRDIIRNQDSGNKLKSEQFRILKENYSITGQYADEDKAYVWFKRFEALDE